MCQRRISAALDVADLLTAVEGDHPREAGVGVVGESDGDDMRCAVGAKRDEAAEVAFGEEVEGGVAEIGGCTGHEPTVAPVPTGPGVGGILVAMADTPGAVVVFGGRSEIGVALATRLAAGRTVVLAARRPDDLEGERAAVLAAGATHVDCVAFDADDTASHPVLIDQLVADHGPIEVAIVAFGILGDQQRAESDVAHALQIAHTDYLAQISVLIPLAAALRTQGSGTIIVFSSIAGVRVRKANYVYGSTKAGLDGFASGMADSLHGTGVHLLLARPGFVIGNMTHDLMAAGTKPAPMSITADQVADAVAAAYRKGRGEVWIPGRLYPASLALRMMPRAIWRRLSR